MGPFTQGVDLPNKRAAKRAPKTSRFCREACPKGRAAAKSVEAALPLQVMPTLCLRIASSQAMLACLRIWHVLACQDVSLPLVLSQRLHNIVVLLFVKRIFLSL